MKSKRNKLQSGILDYFKTGNSKESVAQSPYTAITIPVGELAPSFQEIGAATNKEEGRFSDFLHTTEIKTRQSVYISREVHKEITDIVCLLTVNGTSIGGYVDNVLREHLRLNREEINRRMRDVLDKRFNHQ